MREQLTGLMRPHRLDTLEISGISLLCCVYSGHANAGVAALTSACGESPINNSCRLVIFNKALLMIRNLALSVQ